MLDDGDAGHLDVSIPLICSRWFDSAPGHQFHDQEFHFVQPGLGGPCRECQPCLNDAAAGRGDGQL